MRRIFWKRDEEQSVAKAAFEAKQSMKMTTVQAVRYAQKAVLPLERQRPESGLTAAGQFPNVRDLIIEHERAERAAAVEKIKQHSQEPIAEANLAHRPPEGSLNSPWAVLLEQAVDAVMGHVEERLANAMTTAAARLIDRYNLGHMPPRPAPPHPDPAAPINGAASRKLLPRYVIVGLRGVQAQRIEKDLENLARFKFIPASANPRQVRDAAIDADGVFLMKRFISQAHHSVLSGDMRRKCIFVDGGLTSLTSKIRGGVILSH